MPRADGAPRKEGSMNEVIGTILEAEAKAEEIVRAGEEESRRILSAGNADAERILATAERVLLSERERTQAEAEAKAKAAYDTIVAAGGAQAEALLKGSEEKIAAAAHAVVHKVFGA